METIILQVGSNFDPPDDTQEEILWRIDHPEPTCLLVGDPYYYGPAVYYYDGNTNPTIFCRVAITTIRYSIGHA